MIKFIHCADLHLGIQKYGSVDLKTGLNSRIKEDLEQFNRVINYAINKHVDLFMIAGDIFDKRKPEEIVQREFAKRIRLLIDRKINVIILIGNHEGVTAHDTAHCLSAIDELNNSEYLRIVDDSRVITYDKLNIAIACLPYYDDKVFQGFLLQKGLQAILLGHALIKGAKQGQHSFTTGMHPLNFKNKQFAYKGFGHIHQHQEIGDIVYSGSINKIDFGDENNAKGFIYGKINNGKCEWIFKILNSRKFMTINAVWGQGVKKHIMKKDIKDTIVKLNIEDKKGNAVIPILGIKRLLDKKGAIIDSVNIIRQTKLRVRDKRYKTDLSPEKMLKHYLRKENESVIKRGLKVLKRINQ